MTPLFLYFAAAFGLAYIVGHSAISLPVRVLLGGPLDNPRPFLGYLVALLECPACFGTWTGFVAGAALPPLFLLDVRWQGALVAGCATAGVNFCLARATGLIPDQRQEVLERLARDFMRLAVHPYFRNDNPPEEKPQ